MIFIRGALVAVMLTLAIAGCYSCTMQCPTVTGKREDSGWFGSKYFDLSNDTTATVQIKQYGLYDIGEHYCG